MGIALLEPVPRRNSFLAAFDDVPDPRADNARHDLGELLVVAFVAVLCGAVGLRIEGLANIRAVRGVTSGRDIGLINHDFGDGPVWSTSFVQDARDPAAVGSENIAFDVTNRQRPSMLGERMAAIRNMTRFGGSTMSAYTAGPGFCRKLLR